MPYCPHCGQEIDSKATRCFLCGGDIPPGEAQPGYETGRPGQPGPEPPDASQQNQTSQGQAMDEDGISRDEWLAYVGKKASYYFPRFAKFAKTGSDRYAVSWHWPAFFVSFWWFIYRKMYFWAALNVILSFIPYVNLVAWIAISLSANFIYYKSAKRRILGIKSALPGQDVSALLAKAGGVHRWVPWVAIVVSVVILAFLVLNITFAIMEDMQGMDSPALPGPPLPS